MSGSWIWEGFDAEDFHHRWQRARLAAFPTPATQAGSAESESKPIEESAVLAGFVRAASLPDAGDTEKRRETLLRAVYDNSRKLALSLSRRLGATFEIQDFQSLLAASAIPCFQGSWETRKNARILYRKGCAGCPTAGPFACDYWREALDGLVTALGDKERLVRHASSRHGDPECVDVLFVENAEGGPGSFAWGPLPEHMALDLMETAAYFQSRYGVPIELKGVREGTLFFAYGSATDGQCGGPALLTGGFREMVRERFPGLEIRDITPLAVLGAEAR